MKKIIYAAILTIIPAAAHASGAALTALTEAVAPAALTAMAAPEAGAPATDWDDLYIKLRSQTTDTGE